MRIALSTPALVLGALLAPLALCGCGGPSAATPKPVRWVDDTQRSEELGAPRLDERGAPLPGAPPSEPSIAPPAPPPGAAAIDAYREVAASIIAAARADDGAYRKLAYLTDRIGHRLSGSAGLTAAVKWTAAELARDGHVARTEKVMVPHWRRGPERGELVAPQARPLHLLGLGGTVPTPKGGVTAKVVVVQSWEDLRAKAAEVKGSIVLYDVAMPAYSEDKGSGYGDVVVYRAIGASEAAKLGAVAVLVRSVTAHSLRSPHTGSLRYLDGVAKIPAAAISVEDSTLIARLAAGGVPVRARLSLSSAVLPDAESANVIGELRGRERPEEIVLLGAHLDSWDVGQGAHDDGAGCVIMMQALTTLRKLGLTPRRTIRVVLFTNEENGVRGGKAYAAEHREEGGQHVLAIESDSGGFAPRGFDVQMADAAASARVVERVSAIASLLGAVGASRVRAGHGGTDIEPLAQYGVPTLGLRVDGRTYFDIHHTEADTLDKVDPRHLADNVAAVAVLAYLAAEWPTRLDAP
ncbi:MAG: M20/M25/M40 family metallo-hydrolase [Kofleriaceae bacterium]